MALPPISPRLRLIHNSATARRVEVVVPAGVELDVDADTGAQLRAASTHFELVLPPPVKAPTRPPPPPPAKLAKLANLGAGNAE